MLKSELRQHINTLKRQFTQQQLCELSLPVIMRLREKLHEAKVILCYYSLPDEVYTHQLLDDLVAEGKTVLLPKVIDETQMELRVYTGAQDLEEGAYHIMEPVGERFTDFALIDIALVPGVAFDTEGHRLGRGKGYYDRFLRTMGTVLNVRTIGVCFDYQKVESVPVETYDMPVDEVV